MRRSQIVLMVGILVTASGFGWYYAKNHVSPQVDASYAAGAFTASQDGYIYAYDSAPNIFIGSFTLPAPLNDTLILDGGSNVVAGKNVLTSFPSSVKTYDTNNSDTFDAGDGLISSNDSIISTDDVVLTSAANALQTPASAESVNLLVYFDQGATSGSYDTNEDIYRQVYSGGLGVITDGSTAMRTFESTLAFFDLNSNSSLEFASISTYDTETVLRDTDADSKPSAGDSIFASGYAGVGGLSTSSNVCFDGSVVNDTEYDVGERVWLDVAGDCTSFTTTTDSLLLGVGAPSGTSTEFGTEQEIGYFDTDVSGSYTCSRAGTCEPLFYSGADGTNISNGSQTNGSNSFFDSSMDGADGIWTTGVAWDEAGGAEKVVNIGTLIDAGEPSYVYVDANADTLYSFGEDIVRLAALGTTSTVVTGQTLRLFDAQERIMMSPGTPVSGFNGTSGSIILSNDLHLTAGALDGTGTDRVLYGGSVLEAVPAVMKYFDHDVSGSYVNGDDVVSDADASGYYNADDILSLQVASAITSDMIDDTYLSAVKIYERVGNACVGAGTDTLLGSDVSSPFLAQAITLTKAPYAAADSVASRTLCVYADIANNSVHGKIWQLVIPTNGATFATGTSPTSAFTATTNPVQFTVLAPVTMTANNTTVGSTATYTFTYTLTEDPIQNTKGLFDVTFPVPFDISASAATCTDDGAPVALTTSISGQLLRAVNASGSTVTTGSVIVCTMTGVRNASVAGTSGTFTIGADAGSSTRMFYVDTDNTVTLRASSSDTVITPIANTITLVAPNGGDSLTTESVSSITWSSTGTGISYVNLYYSLDSGSTWTTIATNESNDGAYSWTVPSTASSTAMIKIEGTDLATVSDDDVSDAVFAISSSSGASSGSTSDSATTTSTTSETGSTDTIVLEEEVVVEPEVTITTTSVLTGGIFIKLADSPTIYAVDHALVRHAFFDAQTFFTYQTNFDGVLTVDEDTFNLSTLGDPMPVNPGTILVKFDGSSSVYTVQRDADGAVELGPISDEATLVDAMGDYWIDNMITLEADAFAYYSVASEYHTSTSLADWAASGYLTNSWHLMYPDPVNDPDGDGAATWLEVAWGTSPYDADTDNDGYIDWIEVETGHSPLLDGGR